MSLSNSPSTVEVMGWSSQSLADYMKRLKLTGCDRVVMKGSVTGAQFLQMSESDLHMFPTLYISIIAKLQSEIKSKRKKTSGLISKAQKNPKPVFVEEEEAWNSDEFDNDSDPDYEVSDQPEGEDDYVCALSENEADGQSESDGTSEGEDLELPSHAVTLKPPLQPRASKLPGGHNKDAGYVPTPAERIKKPPNPPPPRMGHFLPKPFRAKSPAPPSLHVDRSKKPGVPGQTPRDLGKSKGSTVKAPSSSTSKVPQIPQPRTPKPSDTHNRADKDFPAPPVPTQPDQAGKSTTEQRQGLDPSWYGGTLTRHQAEVTLREVNKDGAFVVRDSSKNSVEHPFTLMVLSQDRVYNIKIRHQGNSYSLGNGTRNTKCFPGVKEMITHHTHTPLQLIDATDQSSEAQTLCCLLHPAGP